MDYLIHRTTTDSASLQMETMEGKNQTDNEHSAAGSFKEYSEQNTVSGEKSLSTNLTFENRNTAADLPIDQVEENHYVYRRGSTEVHVQTYAASSASDVIDENDTVNMFLKGMNLMSALLCLIMIVITLVIKLAAAITDQISTTKEDEYMLTLYALGFVWTFYYNLKGMCKYRNQIKFSKSNQSSNRWLKGVIVLFGLAIVLKDGLEFISFVMGNISNCFQNQIEATLTFVHGFFIISQVKYLFRFSKVYIRNCSAGSRSGLMFIIAINLSTWIAAVVDETLTALQEESTASEGSGVAVVPTSHQAYAFTLNSTEDDHMHDESSHGDASCQCHSTFCQTVHVAETFLFPFVIEFSLVASCLLYVTWSNIGKQPPLCERVVKPSYKFYNKYTGAAFGGVVFFLTIVFLVLLGTSGSSVDEAEKNYFTENAQLLLYDGFLMGLEFVMLLATLAGFYLFHRIRRPIEKAPMLDQVLLVVCILGPLVVNIFSMVAVVIGVNNKTVTWILTLLQPLVEVFQCLFQLMFILYGLQREPITSASAKETANQLSFGIDQHIKRSAPSIETSSESGGHINKMYLRSRRSSITSVVSRLANPQPNLNVELHAQNFSNAENHQDLLVENNGKASAGKNEVSSSSSPPAIIITQPESERMTSNENAQTPKTQPDDDEKPPQHSILKIVSETKVARPDELRSWLRDVIFFLLLANACLWMFQSLSGTAFTVYQYESIFYGTSAWTTIVMICRPLSIFFRMHSAGCLFEMWSFA